MHEYTEFQWVDLTPERIYFQMESLSQIVELMKKTESLFGIIIAAGETAYSAIREAFPEDTEMIKIRFCPYLEKDQCFAVNNLTMLKFPIYKFDIDTINLGDKP